MKILLTNDDGIESPALNVLALTLAKKHEVTVVAPDTERSGYSHAISLKNKVTLLPAELGGIRAYKLTGTPADCVKFAVFRILQDDPPDVVISGINMGANLGSDVMYSGTVAAAFEGAYLGFKAVALSICSHSVRPDLNVFVSEFILNNLEKLLALEIDGRTILNINFPAKEIAGIAAAAQGIQEYNDAYHADGEDNSFILRGIPVKHERNAPDTDVELNKRGFITITPLKLDMTDEGAKEIIGRVFNT